MTTPNWKHWDKELVDLLYDLKINGFDLRGGTDKNSSHNYTGIYAHLLKKYQQKPGRLLEIGTCFGGSAYLWQNYLPDFFIDMIDINDRVPQELWDEMDDERYDFYQGDAYTKEGLDLFGENAYDVIIDDGPHSLASQTFSAAHYYALLKPGGIMIIEDIQDPAHLEILSECLSVGHKKGVEIFDVRETRGHRDDLIWTVTKPLD